MMNTRAEEVRSRFNRTKHRGSSNLSTNDSLHKSITHDYSASPTMSLQGFSSPPHRTRSADNVFWTQQQQQHVSKDMRSRRFSATPVMRTTPGMGKKSDSGSSL